MVFLSLLTLYLVCGALVTAVIVQDRAKRRGPTAPRGSGQRSEAGKEAALDPHARTRSDLVFRTQG